MRARYWQEKLNRSYLSFNMKWSMRGPAGTLTYWKQIVELRKVNHRLRLVSTILVMPHDTRALPHQRDFQANSSSTCFFFAIIIERIYLLLHAPRLPFCNNEPRFRGEFPPNTCRRFDLSVLPYTLFLWYTLTFCLPLSLYLSLCPCPCHVLIRTGFG